MEAEPHAWQAELRGGGWSPAAPLAVLDLTHPIATGWVRPVYVGEPEYRGEGS